jgi:hypothetical protein
VCYTCADRGHPCWGSAGTARPGTVLANGRRIGGAYRSTPAATDCRRCGRAEPAPSGCSDRSVGHSAWRGFRRSSCTKPSGSSGEQRCLAGSRNRPLNWANAGLPGMSGSLVTRRSRVRVPPPPPTKALVDREICQDWSRLGGAIPFSFDLARDGTHPPGRRHRCENLLAQILESQSSPDRWVPFPNTADRSNERQPKASAGESVRPGREQLPNMGHRPAVIDPDARAAPPADAHLELAGVVEPDHV